VSVLLHGIHQNVPTTWRPGAVKVQFDAGHGGLRGPHGEKNTQTGALGRMARRGLFDRRKGIQV
jgi:hypothetical protein